MFSIISHADTDRARPVVLRIDDEPRVLSALSRTLSVIEVEVQTLLSVNFPAKESLIEAVRTAIASLPVDSLVITDWKMPNLSGAEVVAMAKQAGKTVIVLSGNAPGGDERQDPAMQVAGADFVMAKPWDIPVLRAKVLELLQRPAADQSMPAS